MDGHYVSFPQRPPDDAVPAISKLYSTVHRRIASIVSIATSSSAQTSTSVDNESVHSRSDAANVSLASPTPVGTPLHNNHSIARNHHLGVPEGTIHEFRFPQSKTNVSHASQVSGPRNQSALLMHAAQKAAPSVQSESLTALGDLDYLDTPSSSPTKGPSSDVSRHTDNSVPGFALERELSSESEAPQSPVETRRPSFSREDSISTVLTRLKSGTLSKEFWMKDQNAHACFRCEATFNSKRT